MEVGRSRNQLQKSSSANGPLVPFPSLDSKEGSLSLAAIRQQLRPVLTSRSKTIETNIVQDSSSLYKREHLFSTPPLPNRAPPAIPGTSSDTPLPSCLRLQRVNHFPGPNPTPGGLRLHHSTSKSSPIPIRTKHSIGNVDISRGPLDRGPTQNLQATATAPRNPAACASPSSISSLSSELTVSTPRPVLQESQEESTYYVNSPVSISSTNPDRVGLRGTITWYDGATMNRDFDEIIKNHLDGKLAGFLNTTRGIFIRIGFCLFADDYVEDLHGDQRIFETVDSMLDEVSTGLRTIEVGLRRLLGRCKLAKGSLPPIESLRESQTSDEVYLWGKLNICKQDRPVGNHEIELYKMLQEIYMQTVYHNFIQEERRSPARFNGSLKPRIIAVDELLGSVIKVAMSAGETYAQLNQSFYAFVCSTVDSPSADKCFIPTEAWRRNYYRFWRLRGQVDVALASVRNDGVWRRPERKLTRSGLRVREWTV